MEIWASVLTGLTVVGAWVSLHRRTNGSGPLAQKLDCISERLEWVIQRLDRLEERS